MTEPLNPREIVSHLQLIQVHSKDFSDVPVAPLLRVFHELRKITSCLGVLFDMALNDITTKCVFIQAKTSASGLDQATVGIVIVAEKQDNSLVTTPHETATRKLLPLIRALEFVAILLQNLNNQELGAAIRDAYWKTISRYHSYVVQAGVATATYAAPYKQQFFQQLGCTSPTEYCDELAPLLLGLYNGLKTLYIQEHCWQ